MAPPTDYDIFSERIADVRAAHLTAMIDQFEFDLRLKKIEDTAMRGYREMDELQAVSSQPVAELEMKLRDRLERFRQQEQVSTLLIDDSRDSHGFSYDSKTSTIKLGV
jgi:hypothetical protein